MLRRNITIHLVENAHKGLLVSIATNYFETFVCILRHRPRNCTQSGSDDVHLFATVAF
jgi:hypothetical protein